MRAYLNCVMIDKNTNEEFNKILRRLDTTLKGIESLYRLQFKMDTTLSNYHDRIKKLEETMDQLLKEYKSIRTFEDYFRGKYY